LYFGIKNESLKRVKNVNSSHKKSFGMFYTDSVTYSIQQNLALFKSKGKNKKNFLFYILQTNLKNYILCLK